MMTSPSCLGLPAVRVRRCPPGVCHPRAMERKLIELEDGWAFMKARALGVAWARQAAPCPRAPHRRALRSLRRGHAGALSPVPVCADDVSRVVWCAACRARRAEGDHEAAQHPGGPAGGAVQRGGVHEPVHVRAPSPLPAALSRRRDARAQGSQCLSLSARVPPPRRCPAAAGGRRIEARTLYHLRRACSVAAGVLAGRCRWPVGGVGGKPYRVPPATSP